ncbi:MAG: hypothetical protein ACE14L_16520 [Terriglobales bacterium]
MTIAEIDDEDVVGVVTPPEFRQCQRGNENDKGEGKPRQHGAPPQGKGAPELLQGCE